MKKLFVNVLLFLVATGLFLPCTVANLLIVFAVRQKGFLVTLSGYFYSTALGIDIYANREFRTMWNLLLRQKDGYEFGNWGETISYVLGKNQQNGTLTKSGKIVVAVLNFCDKDHVAKAVALKDNLITSGR